MKFPKLHLFFPLIAILIVAMTGCEGTSKSDLSKFPVLEGPYLGQMPPGDTPQPFASGTITTGMYTRDISMTPDGNELYFCVSAYGFNLIFYSKQIDGIWSEPAPAPFIADYQYMYYEPHVTPDGQRLLFLSNRPSKEREAENEDIWAVNRIEEGWGSPYNLGPPVNSEHQEYFPSTTRDGTLYFTRQRKGEPTGHITRQLNGESVGHIYRSRFVDGQYTEPVKLGSNVNCGRNHYNAFIDPDERYIIVPVIGRADSFGSTDYYIVFRDEKDRWSEPINMGDVINTESGREYSPYVSPDGKFFFFMTSRIRNVYEGAKFLLTFQELKDNFSRPQNGNADIFWVDAGFIEKLRPDSW
jgi:hypothetical protein